MSHEWLAGPGDSAQNIVEALVGEFGKRFREGLADQVASPDKIRESAVREREPLIGALDERHEARRPVEHEAESLTLAAVGRELVQHGIDHTGMVAPRHG
jgi:hypothetical protein